MSFFKAGYQSLDTAWDDLPGKNDGPRRVWMPPGKTQRHLFLDDDPMCFWEHKFQFNGSYKNWEPCVTRNKIGPECPPCSTEGEYPYFVGLHSTINLTPWFTKKTKEEVNFQREMFACKMGSDDKPGVLRKLRKLKEKHGRLRGLIFDIERPGKKTESCGSEFELVEKIDPAELMAYRDKMLGEYLARLNEGRPTDKMMTMEEQLKRSPWESFDYEGVITPRSVESLRAMFPPGGKKKYDDDGKGGDGDGDSGGGYSDDSGGADDDIPY